MTIVMLSNMGEEDLVTFYKPKGESTDWDHKSTFKLTFTEDNLELLDYTSRDFQLESKQVYYGETLHCWIDFLSVYYGETLHCCVDFLSVYYGETLHCWVDFLSVYYGEALHCCVDFLSVYYGETLHRCVDFLFLRLWSVMVAQRKNECTSLSVLSVAQVMIDQCDRTLTVAALWPDCDCISGWLWDGE